jgi:transcriptional regulator of acetoin/glycerol metabolism
MVRRRDPARQNTYKLLFGMTVITERKILRRILCCHWPGNVSAIQLSNELTMIVIVNRIERSFMALDTLDYFVGI